MEAATTIAGRFAAVVDASPNRVAVVDEDGRHTYRAIDETSNAVARALLDSGRDERAPVALWLPAGRAYVAGVLGTLKAGRFYCSLSSAQPVTRTSRIAGDSRSELVVTGGACAADAAGLDLPLIRVDELSPATERILPDAKSTSPYCIYYTSGSTGEPKGVLHSHATLLAHIDNYSAVMALSNRDRLSMLPPVNFAASASDLFGALLNGACVLPFDLLKQGLLSLIQWLDYREITVLHTTPSLFRVLAGAVSDSRQVASVRAVKLGGEIVRPSDVELFGRKFSREARLINGLGITEAGGNVAYYQCPYPASGNSSIIPVGYPVAHVTVEIVDPQGTVLGAGETGEIRVSGRNLPGGYWSDEALTAQRFTRDPETGMISYRTGDVGRMLEDGCLVHLRRRDRLVKIRGFRVYPEEIEQSLRELGEIDACAVVPVTRGANVSLIAFATPGSGAAPDVERILRHLRSKLPDFMIPMSVEIIDELPMRASGKIDYATLDALAEERASSRPGGRDSTPPCSETEHRLAAIWAQVLDREQPGIHDDFFELGGDSLAAAGMIVEIERQFGTRLPPSALLGHPTIAGLSATLADDAPDEDRPGPDTDGQRVHVVRLREAGPPPLFGLHAPGGMVFFGNLARHLGDGQSFYVIQGRGLDSFDAPFAGLHDLASSYVDQMLALQPEGSFHICGRWSPIVLETGQQLMARGRRVALTMVFETGVPRVLRAAGRRQSLRRMAGRVLRTVRSGRSALPSAGGTFYPQLLQKKLYSGYSPQSYSAKVVLFRSRDFSARRSKNHHVDSWSALAGDLEIRVVPVEHSKMWKQDVAVLASHVQQEIDRARAREEA